MGKGTTNFGKKIKILKNGMGKNIKLQGTLYTPEWQRVMSRRRKSLMNSVIFLSVIEKVRFFT